MKKNNCILTKLFPTLKDLKKVFHIELDKQIITRISTGNILKQSLNTNKYLEITFYSKKTKKHHHIKIHRLFFYWHYGYLPKVIDHIDRDRLNNNIKNLRESTISKNSRNVKKINKKTSSKYKGVSWSKKNKIWRVNVCLNYKNIYAGDFHCEDEAGQAYNNKIRKLGLEETSVLNDTPQERARKINLFNEEKEPTYS